MCNNDQIDVIHEYVTRHGKVANRDCRRLLSLSYDETIQFLGDLRKNGILERKGTSSGTHYVLAASAIRNVALQNVKSKQRSTKHTS